MASKSVLKLSTIQDFFGNYSNKALKRGENALESGHLLSFSYDGELSSIHAKVKASQRNQHYIVDITFTPQKVTHASCNCVRGSVSCHHMAAAMIYAFRNVSVTDKSCGWAVKNTKKGGEETKPWDELYPPKKKIKVLENVSIPEVVSKLKDGLKHCKGAAPSLAWLLSPEPVREELTRNTFNLCHPCDFIYSEEYVAAPCKISFLQEALGVTPEKISEVAHATIGQRKNPLWTVIRELRLTASNFGAVLETYQKKVNKGVPSASLLKRLYRPPNLDKIKAILWGREHEPVALQQFCSDFNVEVRETGIWLHECGYLGASPDGLVGEDAILEIKCPYSFRSHDLNDVLNSEDKKYIVYFKNAEWHLNQNHEYYHQIQGQLHLTQRSLCYLVIWTPKSMLTFPIPKVPEWSANIELLQRFYCNHFVPYVRNQRNLSL